MGDVYKTQVPHHQIFRLNKLLEFSLASLAINYPENLSFSGVLKNMGIKFCIFMP